MDSLAQKRVESRGNKRPQIGKIIEMTAEKGILRQFMDLWRVKKSQGKMYFYKQDHPKI